MALGREFFEILIMSQSESRRLSATFIVRLWSEYAEDELPEWRGQVEHVQSDQEQYFHELDKMVTFITSCLEAQENRKS